MKKNNNNNNKVNKTKQTNKKSQTAWSDTVTLLSYILIADFALVSVPGGALGYFLGGYVPPGTQIGTPF